MVIGPGSGLGGAVAHHENRNQLGPVRYAAEVRHEVVENGGATMALAAALIH
jgi:hypothetical protein